MTNEFVSYKFGTGDPTRLGAQVVSESVSWGWNSPCHRKKVTGLTYSRFGIWGSAGIGLTNWNLAFIREQFWQPFLFGA